MAAVTRDRIIKRHVGIGESVDRRIIAYAQRRNLTYSAALTVLAVERLDQLDPNGQEASTRDVQ
jgi:hypothetical protein